MPIQRSYQSITTPLLQEPIVQVAIAPLLREQIKQVKTDVVVNGIGVGIVTAAEAGILGATIGSTYGASLATVSGNLLCAGFGGVMAGIGALACIGGAGAVQYVGSKFKNSYDALQDLKKFGDMHVRFTNTPSIQNIERE